MAIPIKFNTACANVTAISNDEYIGNSVSAINANFTDLDSAICTLEASASDWNSAFTTIAANSARWESMNSTVNEFSALWQDLYTTVNTFSASDWTQTISVIYSDISFRNDLVADVKSDVLTWLNSNFPATDYALDQKINVFATRYGHVNSFGGSYVETVAQNVRAHCNDKFINCKDYYHAQTAGPRSDCSRTNARCRPARGHYYYGYGGGPCKRYCVYPSSTFYVLASSSDIHVIHSERLATTDSTTPAGSAFFGFEYKVVDDSGNSWLFNRYVNNHEGSYWGEEV